jgi:hypothetical protein
MRGWQQSIALHVYCIEAKNRKISDVAGALTSMHDQYVMLFIKGYGSVIMTTGIEQM